MKMEVTTAVDNTGEVKDIAKRARMIALEMIGLQAENYAKRKCAVDTGRLRNSITHTADDTTAYIGTNVEYAPYVEYGTIHMKAQPFLKPAANDHTAEYRDIIEECLRNA